MSSMHQRPRNWVVNGRAVVYYGAASHAFSAGIKCRHCTIKLGPVRSGCIRVWPSMNNSVLIAARGLFTYPYAAGG